MPKVGENLTKEAHCSRTEATEAAAARVPEQLSAQGHDTD